MNSRPVPATRLAAHALRVLAVALLIAYPVLVWQGLSTGSPRTVAAVLLLLVVPLSFLRLRRREAGSGAQRPRALLLLPWITAAGLGIAAALDRAGCMLMVPVAINSVLLVAFGATLRPGSQPMIERFALLQEPQLAEAGLQPEQRAWCRLWTWLWCGLFVVNGAAALVLALVAPISWWAFHNGLLAYVLIGVLLATEWLLRRRRFPRSSAPQVQEGSR